jgi:hypothetical protein
MGKASAATTMDARMAAPAADATTRGDGIILNPPGPFLVTT